MKKFLIFLGILLLVSAIAVFMRKDSLPKTFTLNISSDQTSSGGDRTYAATIQFKDGILADAASRYVANSATGGHFAYDCVAKNYTWVYADTEQACDIPIVIPLSRVAIEREIENGGIKPIDKCAHMDICYEIVPQ